MPAELLIQTQPLAVQSVAANCKAANANRWANCLKGNYERKDLSPIELIRLAESWVGEGNDGMVKYYLEKDVERIEATECLLKEIGIKK